MGFRDDLRPFLTAAEIRVLDEAGRWCSTPVARKLSPMATKLVAGVKRTKQFISDLGHGAYEAIPEALKETIGAAIYSMLALFRDGSGLTISPTAIFKKIQKRHNATPPICKREQIFSVPISELDEVALKCIRFNANCATIEGGITGGAGAPGLVADIPILYGLIFRTVQEVATCYGFRVDTPLEKTFILKVIEIGHETDEALKRRGMTELAAIQAMVIKKLPWKELEKNVVVKALRELAKKLGYRLTKERLARLVTGIGALAGLAMNRKLVHDVGAAAFYAYRVRFLEEIAHERRTKDNAE